VQDTRIVIRRSPRKSYLLAALLAGIVIAAAYLAQLPVWSDRLHYQSAPYALLPAALAAFALVSWFNRRSWVYSMDTNAAVVQWGLLSHHRFGVPLRHIVTLELKQSPIDRVLGVGTVELLARDHDGVERRLDLVRTWLIAAKAFPDDGLTFGDQGAVPKPAILVA